MSNILVTGAKGQLGREIQSLSTQYSENRFTFVSRDELDICNENALRLLLKNKNIDTIINCAAYTAVDAAQTDKDNADKVNHKAIEIVASLVKEMDITFIHISTDYVFDGTSYTPYTEEKQTNPIGVYGSTKLAGENVLLDINPRNTVIIRTSWVYSEFGNNFVKTMLRLGKERDSLGVIFDQVGTPTYAKDLAQTILAILPNIKNENVEIYHYSNEGVASWYDFSKAIMQEADINCTINPIESKAYPAPVKRPHYSVLNKSKIREKYNLEIPYWRDSLRACLKNLGEYK
jgi:dTDP-4-dehydrorhamnose reductase